MSQHVVPAGVVASSRDLTVVPFEEEDDEASEEEGESGDQP